MICLTLFNQSFVLRSYHDQDQSFTSYYNKSSPHEKLLAITDRIERRGQATDKLPNRFDFVDDFGQETALCWKLELLSDKLILKPVKEYRHGDTTVFLDSWLTPASPEYQRNNAQTKHTNIRRHTTNMN